MGGAQAAPTGKVYHLQFDGRRAVHSTSDKVAAHQPTAMFGDRFGRRFAAKPVAGTFPGGAVVARDKADGPNVSPFVGPGDAPDI
jgi:hypothetical protein